jgi:restriction endonuclease S subunit
LLEGLEISVLKLSEILVDNLDFRVDSEYFSKKYLNFDLFLKSRKSDIISKYAKVSDGDHSKFPDNQKEEVRYLQAKDIKNHFIEDNNPVYISREYFNRNKRSHVKEENVILSIMGSVGDIALTPKGFVPTLANRAIAIIKDINELNPYYLFAYLSTKYGQLQIDRQKNGGVQERINLDVLSKVKIPFVKIDFQLEIENIVKNSHKKRKESKEAYTQAENVLLIECGLQNFESSKEPVNIKSFEESFGITKRLDAEYYQKKYDDLERFIVAKKYKRIKEIRSDNFRGLQPVYFENGNLDVINSKHILETSLDYDNFEKTDLEYWEKQEKARVFKDDILTYTTGANIGRTQVYRSEKKALASNHVNIIRLKNENPYYIAFILNSIIGRLQTDKRSAGSAQVELYPKDLDEFMVPIIHVKKQDRIIGLIEGSFELKVESDRLLTYAKKAVEIAIEEGERTAMKFLNDNTKKDGRL